MAFFRTSTVPRQTLRALMFLDGFHRKVVAILLAAMSIPALLGLAMLAITVHAFFRFS
jgi:signal transduction protein with GAF and PtsI domain